MKFNSNLIRFSKVLKNWIKNLQTNLSKPRFIFSRTKWIILHWYNPNFIKYSKRYYFKYIKKKEEFANLNLFLKISPINNRPKPRSSKEILRIDHSPGDTLARRRDRSHVRSCNLLRDKQTPVAGILHRCALRLEAGASRQESRLARDRRSLLSESVSWLRSRQIEAAALRKTSSGPIDLSIPDSLAFTTYRLPFFPETH